MKKIKLALLAAAISTGGAPNAVIAEGGTAPSTQNQTTLTQSLNDNGTQMNVKTQGFSRVKPTDLISDVVAHPAFNGRGALILPWDNRSYDKSLRLAQIGSLLPYHGHVDAATTTNSINDMIAQADEGHQIIYDFYTEAEKRADPSKAATGLFFLRGKPGAPFALISPGGGFAYVGSVHEGFPYASELSRKGYNAFVLKYRVGDGRRATEDLAAALSYIFRNAQTLGVGTQSYSLWGSSAGARMAANVGSYGASAFGGDNLPPPATVVMAYTGHQPFSRTDPPLFVAQSRDDRIVNVALVEERVRRMKNAGIDVEYHKYSHAGHGFGPGVGTDAEGWLTDAIRFWQKYIVE